MSDTDEKLPKASGWTGIVTANGHLSEVHAYLSHATLARSQRGDRATCRLVDLDVTIKAWRPEPKLKKGKSS